MKTAQIGVGGWGKNHLRVLSEMGMLGAICDADGNRAKLMSERYGVPYHTSVDDLLQHEEFDAAIVATPTTTHYQIAGKLIQAGKHTLVEKPLTYDAKQGRDLHDMAKNASVTLSCGYIERFNPAVQAVRNMVVDNTYGVPVLLEFHRENRIPSHIKDVGIIYDTAVHDIDTANWLFGQMPQMVYARCGSISHTHEDFATIMLGYPDNRTAVIACNWLSPGRARMFRVAFADAVVTGDFITRRVEVDGRQIPTTNTEPLRAEIESFLEAARTSRNPQVLPQEAINVSQIAQAALLSAKSNAPMYVDLK